jgi:hypothetical protein
MQKLQKTISLTICMIFIMMFGFSATSMGYAAASKYDDAPQYLIKAGYLYKFFYFVQWPDVEQSLPTQNEKITIGILGKDPFGDYFKQIEGRVIKSLNKRIAVKRLGPYREDINLKQCQILYIGSSEKHNINSIVKRTKESAVLTVADTKGFLELGVWLIWLIGAELFALK